MEFLRKPPGLATHCRETPKGPGSTWFHPSSTVEPDFPDLFSTEALLLRSLIREPITLCLVCFVFVFCVFLCVKFIPMCVDMWYLNHDFLHCHILFVWICLIFIYFGRCWHQVYVGHQSRRIGVWFVHVRMLKWKKWLGELEGSSQWSQLRPWLSIGFSFYSYL